MVRKEAKQLGMKQYSTGKPCKYGHISPRFTSTSGCVECLTMHNTSPRQVEVKKQSRERLKDKENAKAREKYNNTKEYQSERKRIDREKNPEKYKLRARKYQQSNKPKMAAKSAKRRSDKLQATPPWVVGEVVREIEAIYEKCPRGWHVDHVFPLRGDNSCGLHVPENLSIIPKWLNVRKWKHEPTFEQAQRLKVLSETLLAQFEMPQP